MRCLSDNYEYEYLLPTLGMLHLQNYKIKVKNFLYSPKSLELYSRAIRLNLDGISGYPN
jgi:hypothetical protein